MTETRLLITNLFLFPRKRSIYFLKGVDKLKNQRFFNRKFVLAPKLAG